MKLRGLALIALAVLIPVIWFGPMASQFSTRAVFSQYLGAVAIILMGITQLMATRITGIEAIFGSMDRVYILHKWLAIVAVAAGYLHSEIDAEIDGIELIARLGDTAEEMGEFAQNGFIFLVIVSLITIIPYNLWKWSHRLIGLFFALAAFHYILIEKPYSAFDLQGIYITAFCAIGILAYLYLLIPRMVGHNSLAYEVTNVTNHPGGTEVNLKPQGKGINHKAGQFTFLNFNPLMLQEAHPFTISSAPKENGELRFMIKGLGRYTKKLGTALEPGTKARVSSAFGHFSLKPTNGPQVWVGGGIGITPFMAWANTLTPDWPTPTRLYYCVRSPEDALLVNEFEQIASRVENFDFTLIVSKEGKRLSAEQIVEELSESQGIRDAHVYFCGPEKMREILRHGLVKRGLRRSHFHFEEFEMRAGVGIVWFWRRMMSMVRG